MRHCVAAAAGVLLLLAAAVQANPVWLNSYLGQYTPYVPPPGVERFLVPDNCQPKQVYIVARHGSREPFNAHNVATLTKLIKSRPLSSSYSWMANWNDDVPSRSGRLTPLGRQQHHELGQRFATSLPQLFSNHARVDAMSTKTSRTKLSARAFIAGAFPSRADLHVATQGSAKLLRPFRNCPALKTATYMVDDVTSLSLLAGKLSRELFGEAGLVNEKQAKALWKMCVEEHLHVGDSPWCNLLQESDAQVMTQLADLKALRENGQTVPLAFNLGCGIIGDLVSGMQLAVDGSPSAAAVRLRFAHQPTMLMLLSAIGLLENESQDVMLSEARHFRQSKLTPMAANVAFILYDCDGELRVQLTHNERAVAQPGCEVDENLTCSWLDFMRLMERYSKCDVSDMCSLPLTVSKLAPLPPTEEDVKIANKNKLAAAAAATAARAALEQEQASSMMCSGFPLLASALTAIVGLVLFYVRKRPSKNVRVKE